MSKEVKTNLRWPGGKSRMMEILDKYLPPKVDKYLETFTGGGSVLLYIIQKYHPAIVYANDIDKCLVGYYEEVKNNPQGLMQECLNIKNSYDAEGFREGFKLLDRHTPHGFFIANKTSFSGMSSNYSIQAYEGNFSKSAIEKIQDVSDVIQSATFVNSDFKNLDETLPEEITDFFIYLDPPYYGNRKVGLYGKKGQLHKGFDHEELFRWVEAHKDSNLIMMSYDDSPYIRELYKDYNIYEFGFTYCMTNTGGHKCKEGQEIVITNYDVKYHDDEEFPNDIDSLF